MNFRCFSCMRTFETHTQRDNRPCTEKRQAAHRGPSQDTRRGKRAGISHSKSARHHPDTARRHHRWYLHRHPLLLPFTFSTNNAIRTHRPRAGAHPAYSTNFAHEFVGHIQTLFKQTHVMCATRVCLQSLGKAGALDTGAIVLPAECVNYDDLPTPRRHSFDRPRHCTKASAQTVKIMCRLMAAQKHRDPPSSLPESEARRPQPQLGVLRLLPFETCIAHRAHGQVQALRAYNGQTRRQEGVCYVDSLAWMVLFW